MKFTISWLEKFLDLNGCKVDQIATALTQLGLEVETVSSPSPLLAQFIVAEIVDCHKHPKADKLNVCSVNDGENTLNIVCGAPNVRPGLKIVFAPIGSIIPANNIKIEKRKIRDIESEGMICSASELGIGEDSGVIIELDPYLKIGNKFIDECPWLADIMIDISVTPNRADCLGVYGIARDLAAYGIGKLKPLPKLKMNPSSYVSPLHVEVNNTKACPLFIGSYVKNIDNSMQTPLWLRTTLNSIGEKSISPIVDITNYINYAFGRPLHAFDADKLEGGLQVRFAKKGEEMTSLSGDILALGEQDIVVADDNKICALGGIIGAENSKCTTETKNIFLEAAIFNKILIAKTGQRTKINTSAKYRNERGLDFDFTLDGLEIALDMIQEICGGEASDVIIMGNPVASERSIDFDLGLVLKLSGTVIHEETILEILERLGFKIKNKSDAKIQIIIPSWRNDIAIPEDIVEEVLRINGYDKIPTIPIGTTKAINSVPIPQEGTVIMQARSIFGALGFDEMITWSFMSSKLAKQFGLLDKSPVLANPITTELDVMRASLIPNLLSCIQKNNARSFHDLSLFEIGNVFENEHFSQIKMIAAVRSGKSSADNIFKDSRPFDFFDIKGDVLQLLETLFNIDPEEINFSPPLLIHSHSVIPAEAGTQYNKKSLEEVNRNLKKKEIDLFEESSSVLGPGLRRDDGMDGVRYDDGKKELPSWYHPGKSAIISIDNKVIGYVGEIHPSILKIMDISHPTFATELFVKEIPPLTTAKAQSFSDYQPVARDFAFILDNNVTASELIKSIKSIGSSLVKNIHIFDLFTGPTIGEDKKSIAIRVKLQADDHSLTEAEISKIAQQIIEAVKLTTGGVLR
jgi:phenylalanyl-tRNA synthetase beta chain